MGPGLSLRCRLWFSFPICWCDVSMKTLINALKTNVKLENTFSEKTWGKERNLTYFTFVANNRLAQSIKKISA